ncbi:Yip1 family protein [Pseudogracilibacillus auburnensis]|uniref:Yip1 family protein n=1 Tax=Pseudogracilibacillus auburnensis TaxID=1494959 RepID=UPI001A96BF02|nr:Yip1 family protein [Pseudogracilibacillus auburnensis]MBO1002829.1 YIP1 family protein [Pseudogracilibacillus auburnensis]
MTNEMEQTVKEKPSIFGMIMSPGEQFNRIRENPKIFVALLIVTALSIIGSILMVTGFDPTTDPNLAGMSEDELMFVTMGAQIVLILTGLLSPVITVLVLSVIHIIVAKMTQSTVSFKQLFSMNSYIYMISALSFLLNGLVTLFVGGNNEIYFTSLNSIIGAEGAFGAFLNYIEIFTIWKIIITALGLQIVARFSKTLSWSIVIAIFVIMVIFSMVTSGLSSMVGV